MDGQRYFALFDDALISMRYAWNAAHGMGLVWNVGEYVEGYTNPLMVAIMTVASALFSKQYATLAIQITGIVVLIATARQYAVIARKIGFAPLVGIACALAYYPLAYWALMGMETGLVALLLAAALRLMFDDKHDLLLGFVFGLAYLARPDTIIFAVPILLYRWSLFHNPRALLKTVAVCAAVVLLHSAFRLAYYGQLVPNTYILKIEGIPTLERIRNGIGFLSPLIVTLFPLIILAMAGVKPLGRIGLLFAYIIIIAVVYQIWVGGESWAYWRMIAPVMPLFFLLAVSGAQSLRMSLRRRKFSKRLSTMTAALLLALAVIAPNQPYFSEIIFTPPFTVKEHSELVNMSIALEHLLEPSGSIGVFWAGALPYYSGRYAIDFLGKTDPVIARLPPDLSGAISWNGMNSVPGHNKYDLTYSIQQLMPSYVQSLGYARQDITAWGQQYYEWMCYNDIGGYILIEAAVPGASEGTDCPPPAL